MLKEKISRILDLQGKELKRLGLYTIVVLVSFAFCLPFIGRGLTSDDQSLLNKKKSVAESVLEAEEQDSLIKLDLQHPLSPQLTEKEEVNQDKPFLTGDKGNPSPISEGQEKVEAEGEVLAVKKQGVQGDVQKTDPLQGKLQEMMWPVKGEVLRPVGICYWQTFGDYRYHDGVDLKGERGTEVQAALPGKIGKVETSKEEAVKVVIDHGGGWQSVYAHLEMSYLKEGQEVQAGEKIGRIGQPGSREVAMGPHLHFTLSKDGKIINPLDYLQ